MLKQCGYISRLGKKERENKIIKRFMVDRIQANIPLLFSEHICLCSASFSCVIAPSPKLFPWRHWQLSGVLGIHPGLLHPQHLMPETTRLKVTGTHMSWFLLCHFGRSLIAQICTAGTLSFSWAKLYWFQVLVRCDYDQARYKTSYIC